MATPTRTAKRTVTTTYTQRSSSSGDEFPSTSSSPGRRVRSPSPARITRQQEKDQLQNLNDRLAAYIDRVRYLETENSRLSVQVRSTEETIDREVTNIKNLYETELEDARKIMDETSKERARLQIEVGKYKEEAEDWKVKYHKKERELRDANAQIQALQKENADLENRATNAENLRKSLEKECNKLRADLVALERQLGHAKKQLEDETLLRVDLQNRLQSLKEELSFKTQVYEQEIKETKTRTTTEIEEVDARVSQEYEAKLQEALQSMREEQDEQLREVRIEVEMLYEKKNIPIKNNAKPDFEIMAALFQLSSSIYNTAQSTTREVFRSQTTEDKRKIEDVQSALDRSMNTSNVSSQDLVITRRRVDELSSEVTKLKNQNAAFEARIKDLENQLAREQEEFLERMALKEQELSDLIIARDEQTREYADLLDIKIRLDNEILAYRKLLEGEEDRLNISQTSQTSSSTPSRSVQRGAKRKRVALAEAVEEFSSGSSGFSSTSNATGSVEIKETDAAGGFIKIFNTSDQDVGIGGWQLRHEAGEGDGALVTQYKFHRNLLLRAGQHCKIWSSNAGQTHTPPHDLVMKGQKWNTNDHMKSVLINSDGEEVASREMSKTVQRTSSVRLGGRGLDDVDAGRDRSERCAIM